MARWQNKKSPEAFRTIGEVSEILDLPTHVLRYWENRFSEVKPSIGKGSRRLYRPRDVALLAGLKKLLRDDGMTIRGAQKILDRRGKDFVVSLSTIDFGHSITVVESRPGTKLPASASTEESAVESHVFPSALERIPPARRESSPASEKLTISSKKEIAQNLFGKIQDLRQRLVQKIE
ncbi:MAG: MerR family transcriptional regulator [Albidovulum sp.]|nr:MerR family transcriptional regulator [Albidovulum sp.]